MAVAATIQPIPAVDRLGDIKAEIARLTEIAKFLEGEIVAQGAGAYEGTAYRAAVSVVSETKALDVKAAEAKLRSMGVDGRWFAKNMKTRRGYTAVRVSPIKA